MAQQPFQITPSTRRATRQPRGQPTPPFPISSTAGMTPEQIATTQANIEEERRGQTGGNIKLAVIAQEVYNEPSKRTGRDGWKYESGDKRHGIWSKDGKAVVGIRGTDFKDAKDLADDVAIGIGALKLTPRYKRAKKWVKKAIKKYGKNNVEVAGHSLGGKISKSLAKDFGIRGSTFNAGASVSDAASSVLDRTACKINKKGKRCKRAKKVENYRTAIDPVSAAAVADINTTTVKRKKGKDPHAIANFVPEEEQALRARETQEGEGFRDRMSDRYKFLQATRKLRRRRIPLAQIASTPMHVRSFLGDALGGVENIPPDAPETFPSFISLVEYTIRQRDLRRGAEDMPGLEQAGEEEQEGEGFEDLPKAALLEIWNSLDDDGRRNLYVILPLAARQKIDDFTAEIPGVQPPASPVRASRRPRQPPRPPRKRHKGKGEEEQEGGYYGMRGRGMCGTGRKRYDFTQSGTGRRRMMKSKNMVEVCRC